MPPPIWLWRLLWPLRARLNPGVEVGGCFPDFTLRDVSGRPHSLYDATPGRLTILWLTNLCDGCRERIPLLVEAGRAPGGCVRVLAISILGPADPLAARVADGCGFPILLDPEDIVERRLGQVHPPGTCPIRNLYIVNGAGRIRYKHHLSAVRPEEFRGALKALNGG
jgi:peroxiredoxin